MIFKNASFFFLTLLLLFSCENSKQKTEREGEPDIYSVLSSDAGMNEAIQKARQTLDTFNTALNNQHPDYDYFALKVYFPVAADSGEHIWVSDVSLANGLYKGVINNVPELTQEVDVGDTVLIDNAKISDWMFVEAGKLHGGYTIRLLRNRMTDEEKNKFDSENGLIIEEDEE